MAKKWTEAKVSRRNPKWDRQRLCEIAEDRGFDSYSAMCEYLMACLAYHKTKRPFYAKLRNGFWTWGQIKLVADALEMTPQEMIEVFFPDTFITVGGMTFAHLKEDAKEKFRHPRTVRGTLYTNGAITLEEREEKQKKIKVSDEVNAFFEDTEAKPISESE